MQPTTPPKPPSGPADPSTGPSPSSDSPKDLETAVIRGDGIGAVEHGVQGDNSTLILAPFSSVNGRATERCTEGARMLMIYGYGIGRGRRDTQLMTEREPEAGSGAVAGSWAEAGEGAEYWWLAAQVPATQRGVSLGLEILREISASELPEIRKANSFLNRLAAASPYAKLFDLAHQLQQAAIFGPNATARRVAINMNRATAALARAARTFERDLRQQAADDFSANNDKYQELSEAVADGVSKPVYRVLVAVGELERGLFIDVDDSVVIDPEALAALAAIEPSVSPQIDILPTLYNAVLAAQRIIARYLIICSDDIASASFTIRRLAAEVPDGVALLIRADNPTQANSSTIGSNLVPEPLALDSASHLHRAIRFGAELLKNIEPSPRMTGPEADTSGEAGPGGANAEAADSIADAGDRAEQPSDGRLAGAGPGGNADSARDQATLDADAEVIDLRVLATHVTDLANSLERAWSDALSPEALSDVQAELQARVTSFVAAIQRQLAAQEVELRAAGIDTRLGSYPPSMEELGALRFEPEPVERWRQAQMAQINALQLVIDALAALRAPSGRMLNSSTGAVQTWWEAGAFAMLRARARLLAQTSLETGHGTAGATGEAPPRRDPLRMSLDSLMLASEALSYGDAAGAVLHAHLAIIDRGRAVRGSVPEDYVDRLMADPRLRREAPILGVMEEFVRRFAKGESHTNIATLIAPVGIDIASRLCYREPDIINTALAERDTPSNQGDGVGDEPDLSATGVSREMTDE